MGRGALVDIPGLPVELGDARERPGLTCQPPRIGEHTADVLQSAGYDAREIGALLAAGVVCVDR